MRRLLPVLLVVLVAACRPYMGPINVGREYGSPKLPFFITHIAEKNQRMLRKGNIPKHHFFNKILCFKFACRNEARRNKSLHAISYNKFKKKVKKNAKKGEYDNIKRDSTVKKPVQKKPAPKPVVKPDTIIAQPAPEPPLLKRDSLVVLSEFSFELNSAILRADHFPAIDSIINLLVDHPTLIVKISGHTDNTGKEPHNMRLSTNRAKVVAEYMIGNGIAEDRVSFEGFGSSKPIASNNTTLGRSKNRRVEILIHDRGN